MTAKAAGATRIDVGADVLITVLMDGRSGTEDLSINADRGVPHA